MRRHERMRAKAGSMNADREIAGHTRLYQIALSFYHRSSELKQPS